MLKLHSKQKNVINIFFQVDCPKVKADSLSHFIYPEAGIGRGSYRKELNRNQDRTMNESLEKTATLC